MLAASMSILNWNADSVVLSRATALEVRYGTPLRQYVEHLFTPIVLDRAVTRANSSKAPCYDACLAGALGTQ